MTPNTKHEPCHQCGKTAPYVIRRDGHIFCSVLCCGNWGNDLDWWANP